jgi:hypothetical protein
MMVLAMHVKTWIATANKYLYLRSIFPFVYGIIHVVLP